jgi:putative membrane protein insertion efficiency factor
MRLALAVEKLMTSTNRFILAALMVLLRAYQIIISPLSQPRCRYQPTCSEYAKQALEFHGISKGLILSIRRLGRCHPFSKGGVDLVPRPHGSNDSQVNNKS